MIHRLTEQAESRRSVILTWGIATLVLGLITGGIGWSKECSFLLCFAPGAGFGLSICWSTYIADKGLPKWDGIQQYCPHWRRTRTGILLYGDAPESPGIFLPWLSIENATRTEDGILIETKEGIPFHLPAAANEALTSIQSLLTPGFNDDDASVTNPAYLQNMPEAPGIGAYLKVGIPWLAAGLILPFIPSNETELMLLCLWCFGMAALLVLFGHSDFRDEYDIDTFLGSESRHTRRGLHIRGLSGWHYFQPWAGISECLELDTQEYFLKLYDSAKGINIGSEGKILPFSVARRVKVKTRRWRTVLNYTLCVLFVLLGLAWWHYWH